MKIQSILILFASVIILSIVSCKNSKKFEVDTTENRIEVKVHRFDTALIQLDTSNLKNSVTKLYTDYPVFFPLFISDIMAENPADSNAIQQALSSFVKNTDFVKINKKAFETYKDISAIENTLSNSFTTIHHYFPEIKLPEIYFFVSGFNRAVFAFNNFIGIGIDMYLGRDFEKYNDITYKYLTYNMYKEYVPIEITSTILFSNFPNKSNEERLLDNILYQGKIMYLLSIALPNEKPENLIGYTLEQWNWCKANEKEIWGKIIDEKHLFSTDIQLINKYINNAPFTTPISQDSPGRLGVWLGWKIFESYMNNNKNIDLKQITRENKYQQLLELSGYKP